MGWYDEPTDNTIVRLNNGDVAVVPRNNIPEECKDPAGIPWFLWFTPGYNAALKKMYRERVPYDEDYEIKEAWYTSKGVKLRMDRWDRLSKKSKYNAWFYTPRFWKEWGNKLRENIDNE